MRVALREMVQRLEIEAEQLQLAYEQYGGIILRAKLDYTLTKLQRYRVHEARRQLASA